jgi:hypothetical protein
MDESDNDCKYPGAFVIVEFFGQYISSEGM